MNRTLPAITRILMLTMVLCFAHSLHAQNAIDCDGIDDRMAAPNATALIANSNISMAVWVYPTNPAAGWPDFDGIVGFRNESNADFYMLQLSSTNIEVRFRNSSGTAFTINSSTLVLNTWNHYVATYDGSMLRLYRNGVRTDSMAASGTITTTTGTFHMGTVPFQTTDFDLDGRIDDVGLWSRALTAGDVSALYSACSINPADNALQLCYQFNQGVGGGNNTGITQAIDSKGNINATLNGFGLNGTTSNFITYGNPTAAVLNDSAACSYTSPSGNYVWDSSGTYMDTLFNANAAGCDSIITINLVIEGASSATISPTVCGSYTSPSGNYTWTTTGMYMDTLQATNGCDSFITIDLTVFQSTSATLTDSGCQFYTSPSGLYTWTTSGTYMDTIPNAAGCDSFLTINLTVTTLDTSVTLSGNTLSSNATNVTYQWLACDNNFAAIPSATNATYTPGVDGNYAVAITRNGCTDTSACTMVVLVGIDGAMQDLQVQVVPNPHADGFAIQLSNVFGVVEARVFDPAGKAVAQAVFHDQKELDMAFEAPTGLYFVHLQGDGWQKVVKVLRIRRE